MILLVYILPFVLAATSNAQTAHTASCSSRADTLRRKVAAGVVFLGADVGMYDYFQHEWWSGTPAKPWYIENDWDEAFRDQDKLGHGFGAYQLTRAGTDLLTFACMPEERAVLWAALYAYVLQFQIELWDGTQKMYGFSPADLIADATGATLAVGQRRFHILPGAKLTFSYSPTLAYRRRYEPGHNSQPRASIDYSGQTYWLSIPVTSMLPASFRPEVLSLFCVSAGHSITDYVEPMSGATIRARRKFLLTLDLDLEGLPGNYGPWRTLKHQLSYYHLPAPALQLTPHIRGLRWYR